jgi:hypothetical protein
MATLDDWAKEERERVLGIIGPYGGSESRAEEYVMRERERVERTLTEGLDVGGLVRSVVPVTLERWPQGWVFVAQGGATTGQGYLVSQYI